ncbi:MAG: hypothetical protein KF708_07040 [Pirellulales bacterium]|nr:hypothetical protein [Pirellulales bacterium]
MSRALLTALMVACSPFAPASAFADEPQAGAVQTSPKRVLLLETQRPDLTVEKASGKLLVRELLRQAILIAARDELGMATRDETLREPFPQEPGPDQLLLDVLTARAAGKFVRVTLTSANASDPVYHEEIASPFSRLEDVDYLGITVAVEERSRGQFVQALRDAGAAGEKNKLAPEVEVPDVILALLAEMNEFSQYNALRRLHRLHREEGESPATLGALVRGYANLGQLTQYHWNASHKVFKARALLYAQRLIVADRDSAWARWHRAYALALTGLHGLALEDLAQAEREQKSDDVDDRSIVPPSWVRLIDACCRYDTDRLRQLATEESEQTQLAWFLSCLSVEGATLGEDFALRLAHESLQHVPDCLRIVDGMCGAGGVSNLHYVTVYGPQVHATTLPMHLHNMDGMPEGIPALLPERDSLQPLLERHWQTKDILSLYESHPEVIARLLTLGKPDADTQEPSWSVLARFIEDISFVHAVRRGLFFMNTLGVPVEEFARQAEPILANHPYRAFIATAALQPQRDRRNFWTPFEELDIVDVEMTEMHLIRRTWDSPHRTRMQGAFAFDAAYQHADNAAREMELCMFYATDENKKGFAHGLLKVSPYSPAARARIIRYDSDSVASQIDAWDRESDQHPVVLGSLVRYYDKQGRTEDVRRCLTRFLDRSSDLWAVERMAKLYLDEGDVDQWQKTLEAVLERDDFGLTHARVRVTLADYFMEQKDWKKACPYADAAASSGAGWAMLCAARCYEGLGDYAAAERHVRNTSVRYKSSQTGWYFWCKNTGHGDVARAKALALGYHRELGKRATANDLMQLGVIHMLDGDTEKALQAMRQSLTHDFSPYAQLYLVLLYDRLGDTKKCQHTLKLALDKLKRKATNDNHLNRLPIGVATLMLEMFDSGEFRLDDVRYRALMDSANKSERADMDYYLGALLEQHGNTQQGRPMIQRCAETAEKRLWVYSLARVHLRDRAAEISTDDQK